MRIELYTDGACRGNGTTSNPISGIGCVLLIPGQEPICLKQKLDFEPNTNNKAEIYAIIQGINLIYKNFKFGFDFVPDELIIYSDSAYTINVITNDETSIDNFYCKILSSKKIKCYCDDKRYDKCLNNEYTYIGKD